MLSLIRLSLLVEFPLFGEPGQKLSSFAILADPSKIRIAERRTGVALDPRSEYLS